MIAALAASCTKDHGYGTLSPDGRKTPLLVEATLGTKAATKASDNYFDADEHLLSYVRHVKEDGSSYSSVSADKAPMLVEFVYGGSAMTAVDASVNMTSDLSVDGGLYWDDFSDSSDPETDLRTQGHALQSYYGYGYNGGTPTTALDESAGVLGWTAPADQSTALKVRNADLLWSTTQAPVAYSHSSANSGGVHGTLTIPYTHAMSKVSVNIVAGDGFSSGAFEDTEVKLLGFNNSGEFSATDAVISDTSAEDILMYGADETQTVSKPSRLFSAMTVPQTELTVGDAFLEISDVDGNNYSLAITDAIMEGWGSQLDASKATMSGVHYFITVNVSKVKVSVVATILDWTAVSAEGTGSILFDADVVNSGKINDVTASGASFDLWRLVKEDGDTQDMSNDAYGTKETTSSFNGSSWVNSPVIYWADAQTSYYFRALASYGGSSVLSSVNGSLEALQGRDIVWGTTDAHTGKEADGTEHPYAAGQAINPRTSEVPMVFEHVMSQVTVNLTTDASAVNLVGAAMSIAGLYDKGTVRLADGDIEDKSSTAEVTLSGLLSGDSAETGTKFSNVLVMPQSLEGRTLSIVLADGTRYSVALDECLVSGTDDLITEWERGRNYTYTIVLSKEKVQFLVRVKDWVETEGSGNANLDWD